MKKKYLLLIVASCMALTACGSSAPKKTAETSLSDNVFSNNNSQTSEQDSPVVTTVNDLDAELESIEYIAASIETALAADRTQEEYNELAAQLAKVWEDKLNSLLERFSASANAEYKEKVLEEQAAWATAKEERIKDVGSKYEGGSMQPMVEFLEEARLTKARVYIVASYLGNVTGEVVSIPATDYSGIYVNTRDTMEAYDKITLSANENGSFATELNVYETTTFTGTTIEVNGKLEFTADDESLKGYLSVNADNNTAVFVVTDSTNSSVPAGYTIYFDEKWNLED